MSSSNRVRVSYIKETTYGETPVAGDFETMRFTSESLSGSPDTVESQQIRSDRQSSGQIVVGLNVGGDSNFELAKESQLEDMIESAMYNDWVTGVLVAVDLTIDTTLKTIVRASGDWTATSLRVGDVLELQGFVDSRNNTKVMISSIDSANTIGYVGPDTMVDEVGSGTDYTPSDYIEIGLTKKSLSIEKKFEDLTTKGINYTGMIAEAMSINIAYGEIITGSFTFLGNGYSVADTAAELITDGRTVNSPATTNSFNGSVDFLFSANSAGQAKLVKDAFCIQSIALNLVNNNTPQTCIGQAAPVDYSEGTAQIGVDITAYNEDESWNLLDQKLDQTPFEFGAVVENGDGYYGFYLPSIQVSFDDPSSGGQNQDVFLEMSGTAKVGPNQERALRIYRG